MRRVAVKAKLSISENLVSLLKKSKSVRVRAGIGRHRLIGIWFVIVKARVFARSWSIKEDGWYQTFLRESSGAIQIGKSEVAIRARPVRSKSLRDAVDRAYRRKYNSEWEKKYVKDLCTHKCRVTTTEFVLCSEKHDV